MYNNQDLTCCKTFLYFVGVDTSTRERERESRETGRVVKRYNDIRRERIERKSG
jgi:hypothetical protein